MNTFPHRSCIHTRVIYDALKKADEVLADRATKLLNPPERIKYSKCFAEDPHHSFKSWAYTAAEFEQTLKKINGLAPELSGKLSPPLSPHDITVIGHCDLSANFDFDSGCSASEKIKLKNQNMVRGVRYTSTRAFKYSNGLIALPSGEGNYIYLYQPDNFEGKDTCEYAKHLTETRGEIICNGLSVHFPEAETSLLIPNEWVGFLRSEDGVYQVKDLHKSASAALNKSGLFILETQIIEITYLSLGEELPTFTLDGPFLVFFADTRGIHAAVWFSFDSFINL